ncbi:hypothetical protein [Nostoc sp. UIC 10630]|uniref:hypothetical protein n=1 Tax=Nostoc sp. UIC 10630 TaxID=2100146 RepID=UPI0013CF9F9F|nr:hypothetical protein [Nostoc sp. UIC 10630]NEU82804.1 hypothetical protein [Nostoc sp. UIC 10630]
MCPSFTKTPRKETLNIKNYSHKGRGAGEAGGRRQKVLPQLGIQTPPEKEPPFGFASPTPVAHGGNPQDRAGSSLLKQQDRAGSPNFQFGVLVLNPRPYGRGKRQIA